MFCFFSASFHVAFVSVVFCLSLFILVVVIQSVVSLSFIFRFHLISISCAVCSLSWITLSHRITHIRWLASEMSICSSLVCPFVLTDLVFSLLSIGYASVRAMLPIPNIVPRVILGYLCWPCGHISSAFLHIRLRVSCLHSRSMCSIDSIVLHLEQVAFCSQFGTPLHFSPIMYAWFCIGTVVFLFLWFVFLFLSILLHRFPVIRWLSLLLLLFFVCSLGCLAVAVWFSLFLCLGKRSFGWLLQVWPLVGQIPVGLGCLYLPVCLLSLLLLLVCHSLHFLLCCYGLWSMWRLS